MVHKLNLNQQQKFNREIEEINRIFTQKLNAHRRREALTNLTESELMELARLTTTLGQAKGDFIAAQNKAFITAQNDQQQRQVISDLTLVRELLQNTTPEKIEECRNRAIQGAYEHNTTFWKFMAAALFLTGVAVFAALIVSCSLLLPLLSPLACILTIVPAAIVAAASIDSSLLIMLWQILPCDTSVRMEQLIDAVDEATVAQQAKKGSDRLGMFQPQKEDAGNEAAFSDADANTAAL